MATLKQLEANRRNALKSTGPSTDAGKAASSTNALKTGIYAKSLIIPGEDAAELEALIADFYVAHQPAAADERSLVDTLISNEWIQRRLRNAERQIWEQSIHLSMEQNRCTADSTLEDSFLRREQRFTVLRRQVASCERSFHRALRDLEWLKKLRRPATPPQPADSQPKFPKLASFPQKQESLTPALDPPSALSRGTPPLTGDPRHSGS